ncbi:unnamed protein product [Hydatigera taeniaeformis]|uniref:Uncharacterized protein n=1 Tax=Hydatigena taeniaeformis TaxID=6205 RepID=A0A3P7FH27_HYDTA|nr:unnamed protein product [Hydatigera taeniaeformis]
MAFSCNFPFGFFQFKPRIMGYVNTFFILSMITTATELIATQNDEIHYRTIRNPDCDNSTSCPKNETKLIQIIARHPNRTIHFLLPGNKPDAPLSIIMLECDTKPNQLHVNWTRFLSRNGSISNSISLNGTQTSYGMIINELASFITVLSTPTQSLNSIYNDWLCSISPIGVQFCTYSDVNDDARLSPIDIQSQCNHMLGKNLIWTLTDNAVGRNPPNFVYTAVNSTDGSDGLGKVVVDISFPTNKSKLAQEDGFSLTPGKGLVFSITIDSVKVPKKGRVALILLPFSQDPLQEYEDFTDSLSRSASGGETLYNLHLDKRQNLPEHRVSGMQEMTPRVSGHTSAFMQWTTTCEVSEDGVAKRHATANPRMQIPKRVQGRYRLSLPVAFYGDAFYQKHNSDQVNTSVGVRLQAVTFGSPHDGFYTATNFVRW